MAGVGVRVVSGELLSPALAAAGGCAILCAVAAMNAAVSAGADAVIAIGIASVCADKCTAAN